jgi:hypothetical protein
MQATKSHSEGIIVKKTILLAGVALFLAACAGPQITRTQPLAESADAPYDNILVVSLFQSFDTRRFFEQEIVKQLKARDVDAIASTSMMDGKTPLNLETISDQVDRANSDAVLVTEMLDVATTSRFRDRRPEATYNVRPTYYHNVWNVEMTEYSEPKGLEAKHALTMATQVFSVSAREPVWTIESHSELFRDVNAQFSGTSIVAEASAIANAMKRDGLLAR